MRFIFKGGNQEILHAEVAIPDVAVATLHGRD